MDIMKKNYLFTMMAVMMLAMVSLTGCDKDDDGISGNAAALDSYEDSYSFEWVIDGDKLIFDEWTSDEARCTIEKLNGNTLVLYYFEEDPREDYEYHERETFERVGNAR